MIRAIYEHGGIRPLDDIPHSWHEGQELVVNALPAADDDESPQAIDKWATEVRVAAEQINDEEHDRLMAAMAEVEAESKELARREMERSS